MKRYTIDISERAAMDLEEIDCYFIEIIKEPEVGQIILQRLKDSIVSLETMPLRHPFVNDEFLRAMQIRLFPVDSYIVFYTVRNDIVKIVRVLHGKRDWMNLL